MALKNKRHEAFAVALARGKSATDAYRATYGTKAKNPGDIASRLSDKVRSRVEELQKASATATVMDMQERRERITAAARRPGVSDRDLVALILAEAKLAGELSDKVEVSGQIKTTPADLLAAVRNSPALRGLPLNATGNS